MGVLFFMVYYVLKMFLGVKCFVLIFVVLIECKNFVYLLDLGVNVYCDV